MKLAKPSSSPGAPSRPGTRELADPERPYWLPPASHLTTAAHTVVARAADLKRALIAYREATEIRRQDNPPDRDPW